MASCYMNPMSWPSTNLDWTFVVLAKRTLVLFRIIIKILDFQSQCLSLWHWSPDNWQVTRVVEYGCKSHVLPFDCQSDRAERRQHTAWIQAEEGGRHLFSLNHSSPHATMGRYGCWGYLRCLSKDTRIWMKLSRASSYVGWLNCEWTSSLRTISLLKALVQL
jgi:hypothetical protein